MLGISGSIVVFEPIYNSQNNLKEKYNYFKNELLKYSVLVEDIYDFASDIIYNNENDKIKI